MKFVDKQLAIKLKEKGFDRPCFGYYYVETPTGMDEGEFVHNKCNTRGAIYKDCLYSSNYDYYFDAHLVNKVDAPTIEQVLKWLRDEKKIYFNIFPYHYTGGIYCTLNSIWQVNMDVKFETKEYDINIPYETYEDACIAGIEYVVEHLI